MKKYFRKKVVEPVLNYLKQGVTPKKLSSAVAFGVVIGVVPLLGTTTILCALTATWLRLNMGLIQLINYVVYPLQLILFVPFIKVGTYLVGAAPLAYSAEQIIELAKQKPLELMYEIGYANVLGVLIWLIAAPVVYIIIYQVTHYLVPKQLAE